MISNTHDGGRNLMPVVMGGEGDYATHPLSPTSFRGQANPLSATKRAAGLSPCFAAHQFDCVWNPLPATQSGPKAEPPTSGLGPHQFEIANAATYPAAEARGVETLSAHRLGTPTIRSAAADCDQNLYVKIFPHTNLVRNTQFPQLNVLLAEKRDSLRGASELCSVPRKDHSHD